MASEKGDGRGQRGQIGESAALALLERQQYRVVDTNVRLGRASGIIGEIDIVAWDDQTLCFVEVKTRRGTPGRVFPGESVTEAKQRQLVNLALAYANRCGLLSDDAGVTIRFDVVLVVLSPRGGDARVLQTELWRDAFQAPDGT